MSGFIKMNDAASSEKLWTRVKGNITTTIKTFKKKYDSQFFASGETDGITETYFFWMGYRIKSRRAFFFPTMTKYTNNKPFEAETFYRNYALRTSEHNALSTFATQHLSELHKGGKITLCLILRGSKLLTNINSSETDVLPTLWQHAWMSLTWVQGLGIK